MIWFAILLLIITGLLDGGGGINIVEARRRQSRNNNNRMHQQPPQKRQHPAANRNRLRSTLNYHNNNDRNGYSPNLDAIYDEAHGGGSRDSNNKDTFYSKSFYERHNMNTPPLISRAERNKQQKSTIKQQSGRVLQTQDNGSNILTIPDSPIVNPTTNEENNTELDSIIETSKLGLDSSSLLRHDLIFNGYYDRHSYPW